MHHWPTQYMQPERNLQVHAYPIKCMYYLHLELWNNKGHLDCPFGGVCMKSSFWKTFQGHFTGIKIFKFFSSSNPSVAGSGQYRTSWAFQNVLCHFTSSIRAWIIGQNRYEFPWIPTHSGIFMWHHWDEIRGNLTRSQNQEDHLAECHVG